jgi:hypothetical protein
VNVGCGVGLELVLEDDETEELEIRFGGLTEAQSASALKFDPTFRTHRRIR